MNEQEVKLAMLPLSLGCLGLPIYDMQALTRFAGNQASLLTSTGANLEYKSVEDYLALIGFNKVLIGF